MSALRRKWAAFKTVRRSSSTRQSGHPGVFRPGCEPLEPKVLLTGRKVAFLVSGLGGWTDSKSTLPAVQQNYPQTLRDRLVTAGYQVSSPAWNESTVLSNDINPTNSDFGSVTATPDVGFPIPVTLSINLGVPNTPDAFVSSLTTYLETNYDGGDTVVLVGYSLGGDAVLRVANRLAADENLGTTHVSIALLATLDPVGSIDAAANPGTVSSLKDATFFDGQINSDIRLTTSFVGGQGGGPVNDDGRISGFRAGLQTVPSSVKFFYNRWQTNTPFPLDYARSGQLSSAAAGSLQSTYGIVDQSPFNQTSRHTITPIEVAFNLGSVTDLFFGKTTNQLHQSFPADLTIQGELATIAENLGPKTFTVTTTSDSGSGSLRQAIIDANAAPGLNTIAFAIGQGTKIIQPTSPLPIIADPVILDATTQPGFAGLPIIELRGDKAGSTAIGLKITAGHSLITGLSITGFEGAGIQLEVSGLNTIRGNGIGVSASGTTFANRNGIVIAKGSSDNTIGGTTQDAKNLISGNTSSGVDIRSATFVTSSRMIAATSTNVPLNLPDVATTTSTLMVGSATAGEKVAHVALNLTINHTFDSDLVLTLIAPDNTRVVLARQRGSSGANYANTTFIDEATTPISTGSASFTGMFVPEESLAALIGKDANGTWSLECRDVSAGDSGRLLSWSLQIGVGTQISAGDTRNLVEGNLIGTDISGLKALANYSGVVISAAGNTIGGMTPGARNVISGNSNLGVSILGSNAMANVVVGNYIGTDATGEDVLPNEYSGVLINGSSNNTIGGGATGAGNVVSGNRAVGVAIQNGDTDGGFSVASHNVVAGNRIGTDAKGLAGLANLSYGVQIDGSSYNIIGGSSANERNIVSGNVNAGIAVGNALANPISTFNRIEGNVVGLDIFGQFLGNGFDGLQLVNTYGNTIKGNVVSGNNGAGLLVKDLAGFVLPANQPGNLLVGNLIGLDPTGTIRRSNFKEGLFIDASPRNTIGGTTPSDRNVISGNLASGLLITQQAATGNLVIGNYIGTDISGKLDLGNGTNGIFIIRAPKNTIGGISASERNVISANKNVGLLITGVQGFGAPDDITVAVQGGTAADAASARANLAEGNYIGLDMSGSRALGNLNQGVFIFRAEGVTIGGSVRGAGNIISANNSAGVAIQDRFSVGNLIVGNKIGTDAAGGFGLGNGGDGVTIYDGSSTNTVGGAGLLGNLISGNSGNGVDIAGNATPVLTNNLIVGNTIGTDILGSRSIANQGSGVLIKGAIGSTIGGAGELGNLISGNNANGVAIDGNSLPFKLGNPGNLIIGNRIGTDSLGTRLLSNQGNGVLLNNATGNTIGGNVASQRNIISGNIGSGVAITLNAQPVLGDVGNINGVTSGLANNTVIGNYIGTDLSGSRRLGNAGNGVFLSGSFLNLVASNVVSANGQVGLALTNDSRLNVIQSNVIGLDVTRQYALGNVNAGVTVDNSPTNLVVSNVISANSGPGIQIVNAAATGNQFQGNLIGTDGAGLARLGNSGQGVNIIQAGGNQIGGLSATDRNVISGNGGHGIAISGPSASANQIMGNYIGTDVVGLNGLGNAQDGVFLSDADRTQIGSSNDIDAKGRLVALHGNVISANVDGGVRIVGASAGTVVEGNLIGTDRTGFKAIGNGGDGVLISGSVGVIVGGTSAPARNVISANTRNGVEVEGLRGGLARSLPDSLPLAIIAGNDIGTDFSGTGSGAINGLKAVLGNSADGVRINGSQRIQVGPGNLISSNGSAGVEILGRDTFTNVPIDNAGNEIIGNLIGTDRTGTVALPNSIGVLVTDSSGNDIGMTRSGVPLGNVISGNSNAGVQIGGQVDRGNLVAANLIGTDRTGTRALGNAIGITLAGGKGNTIGGSVGTARNVLSGNTAAGLLLSGGTTSTVVMGNIIGLDSSGGHLLLGPDGLAANLNAARQQAGVIVVNSPGNIIGGGTASAGNVISGNLVGVAIDGFNTFLSGRDPGTLGTIVQGNLIGIVAAGQTQANVGNRFGIYVNASTLNLIGGVEPGQGNVISGNTSVGIELFGPLATGNLVQGNAIGTDKSGSVKLPNGTGIYIESARPLKVVNLANPQAEPISLANTIGGKATGASNLIANNLDAGIYMFGNATGNHVLGNRILNNRLYGIILYNSAGNSTNAGVKANTVKGSSLANFREFTGLTTKRTDSSQSPNALPVRSGGGHPKAIRHPKPVPHAQVHGKSAGERTRLAVPGGPLHRGA